jgi:hypothetical protein
VNGKLRNALLVGFAALAIGALSCTGAAALSFEDISGKWCTSGGSEQFDREHLIAVVAGTGEKREFAIVDYDFGADMIRVTWRNEKGERVHTDFAEFTPDGQKMVQLKNDAGPRRPFRRC